MVSSHEVSVRPAKFTRLVFHDAKLVVKGS